MEDQIIGSTSEKERVTEKGKEKVPNDTILIENEKESNLVEAVESNVIVSVIADKQIFKGRLALVM